jgi:hypothetical protein
MNKTVEIETGNVNSTSLIKSYDIAFHQKLRELFLVAFVTNLVNQIIFKKRKYLFLIILLSGAAINANAQCTPIITSYPYSEGFETGSGVWSQGVGDDFDWTRDLGGTSSSQTGPSTGSGSTWYMYIETSYPRVNGDEAWLESDCFDFNSLINPTIDFDYHMYGASMGSLELLISINNGVTWTMLRTLSGNQGNTWNTQTLDLSAYAGQAVKFRFKGTRGTSYTGDATIDNIKIYEPCMIDATSSLAALCSAGTVDLSLSGHGVGASIQWQESTGGAFTDIVGATSVNYTTGTLSTPNTYLFRAKVTNSCSLYSDTVSVLFVAGTNNAPNHEGLETSFGIWTNSTADNNNWSRNSGGTSSSGTGPSAAAIGLQYAFVESSNPYFNSTAILEANFNFTGVTNPELSFDYHMYGADMGSLSVVVNGTTVWSLSGQQHAANSSVWSNQVIDLIAYANSCSVNIQFVNNTGNSYTSDIGLDNINVIDYCALIAGNATSSLATSCTAATVDLNLSGQGVGASIQWQKSTGGAFADEVGATSANYTTGTLSTTNTYLFRAKVTNGCSSYSNVVSIFIGQAAGIVNLPNQENLETSFGIWTNSTADNNNWIRNSGGTSSSGTGPSAAASGLQYAFVESSNPYFNSTAILEANFDFTGIPSPELSFDYHMYGANMGSLSVVVNGTTVWSLSGQQHAGNSTAWSHQVIDLIAYANSCDVNIQFVNITGSSYMSDIGLDNIDYSLKTTLPIELLNFNATALNNDQVKLDWQTASEINNDYFTIERSENGLIWKELPIVNGAGNSSQILNYNIIDQNPHSEVSYYKLKQTDYDGSFEYSKVVSVNLISKQEASVFIYPNPTSGILTIKGDASELEELFISNVLGQNVISLLNIISRKENHIIIDLSNLKKGFYTVKTKSLANKVFKQ